MLWADVKWRPVSQSHRLCLMTAIKIIVRNSVLIDATNYSHYKNHSGLLKRVLHFYEALVWKLNLFQHFSFPKMSPLFLCKNKLTVCSAIKESLSFFFHMWPPYKHEVHRGPFFNISWDYIYLTVALLYVVSMTTVWGRVAHSSRSPPQ